MNFNQVISNFILKWNEDPNNRTRDALLFTELQEAKDVMMESLEKSMARGEKTTSLLNKSEELVETSIAYKSSAR